MRAESSVSIKLLFMRTIAHISDLHFGRLDGPVAEGLVADLRQRPPSLLVISGDFTQRAGRRQYAQAAEYRKRLPQPQLVVPGNHDVPAYDVFSRVFFPLRRYRKFIAEEINPVYQDEEMLVVGVNTARGFTQKSGWIRKNQMEQMVGRFSAAPAGLMKVLVTHHPFIPAPRDLHGDVIRGGRGVLERLEAFDVDLLLAGHLHLAYHDDVRVFHTSAKRSVLSVQAGTATSTRRRGQPNAYNWITLSPDRVSVSVRTWNGTAFEESVMSQFQRIDHQWMRATRPIPAPGGE
jgi:3',5'-cyclic AMP phosphodiesterase CpdA